MSDIRIAVVNGGKSAEADVSRSSARGVIEALKEHFSSVTSVELDSNIVQALADCKPDVVFPILHGPPGEDGTLQGFLEILGYRYVGSDVHASAFAMDKIVAKDIFRTAGLPVAQQCVVTREADIAISADSILKSLGESVVVKPACQGSAIGVTLVSNADELHQALQQAFEYDPRLLVEERIMGREITVGVIDTDAGTKPFPVIEITTPENSWYDFAHRYTQGWSEHLMPADLPDEQTWDLQSCAVAAHQALGCRDLSRADFVVTDDDIYLLEVNTLPGMTPTSLYPDGARGYGMEFPELVKYLVERAANR
ncbi:MAG: D-alanine--D-alanine ligase [Pseudomonadales bacterium]|jgi:D-alanine-D-alanine ligase|nr:D-alanine--D-alanine ligase [Pseudomonadales bacterium]